MTSADDAASRRRPDPRERLRRDVRRYRYRESSERSFWQSLSVLGSVGWPIVVASVGGALAGRWMHAQWATGSWLTAVLVGAGAALGMMVAWRLIRPRSR